MKPMIGLTHGAPRTRRRLQSNRLKKKIKVITSYDFPQGTGRAHDTALVCKWLASELNDLDDLDVDAADVDLFRLLKWTLSSSNKFMSKLHKKGVFMDRASARSILMFGFNSAEGYGGLASLCSARKWALFRMRPKLHLYAHSPRAMELQLLQSREDEKIFNVMSSSPLIFIPSTVLGL